MNKRKPAKRIADFYSRVKEKLILFVTRCARKSSQILSKEVSFKTRLKFKQRKKNKDKPIFRFNSVRFEISVIYTLILGVILLTFSSVFFFVTSRTLYDELDNGLRIKAEEIIDNISSYLEVKGEEPKTLQYAVEQTIAREDKTLRRWWFTGFERSWFKRLDEQDLSEDFVNFIFLTDNKNIHSKNLQDNLLDDFLGNIKLQDKGATFWNLYLSGNDIRVINYPFERDGEPKHIIQVGVSKGPVIRLLNEWMLTVLMSIPVILLITGFIGRLLASRILKPLERIIDTAEKISYENLNLKVEPKLHYREMDHLIKTFNSMLSRLEKSFEHIDEFNTHVAHELKTPLTIIRGEAELSYYVAKSKESKESLKVIIDEIDKVLKTIEDLLFLGRTRYQTDSFCFEDVNLTEFLQEIFDQFHNNFSGKNLRFKYEELDSNLVVRADRLHLRRLFFNLLDNAIKYTPEGGKVFVSGNASKDKVYITIKDTGVGISNENLNKIFDQFFREENDVKGVGLGLSIAQAIAKAHYGEITVESRPEDGTQFTVVLPCIKILESASV